MAVVGLAGWRVRDGSLPYLSLRSKRGKGAVREEKEMLFTEKKKLRVVNATRSLVKFFKVVSW